MTGRRPQQQRGHEKRKAVLEGAARMFDRVGFAQASLSDIARESGVTSGAAYFYFQSKEDMALAIINEQNARTFAALGSSASSTGALEGLILASRTIADLILTDEVVRAGLRLSLEQGTLSGPTQGFYVDWMAGVAQAFERAEFRNELATTLSPIVLSRTLVMFFTGVQLVTSVLDGRKSLYPTVEAMWRVFIPGVAACELVDPLMRVATEVFNVPYDSHDDLTGTGTE